MKTVGELLINPYDVDDIIAALFNNNYVVELSKIKVGEDKAKIQVIIKEK